MPIIQSAKKKQKQDRKKENINLAQKKEMLSAIRVYRKKPTKALLVKAFSALDKSAKKNVIHPNKAARLKSRLSKLLKNKSA